MPPSSPSRPAIACGCASPTKGFTWHEIEVRGRAAHGSRYEEGVDAIVLMGHVLVGLGELDRSLRERAEHPLLGFGSLHASLIEGGQELSSYPDRCLLRLERRTLPGEDRAAVEAELRGAIGEIPAELRTTFVREPFEVGADQPIVTLVREVLGGGEPIGVPFWADSGVLSAAGIPTVIFGPGGAGAHAVEEWVDLTQLDACARALVEVAERFCV